MSVRVSRVKWLGAPRIVVHLRAVGNEVGVSRGTKTASDAMCGME